MLRSGNHRWTELKWNIKRGNAVDSIKEGFIFESLRLVAVFLLTWHTKEKLGRNS